MGFWFWESSQGEPVYLGYSWLRPGTGDNADPNSTESLAVWAVVVGGPFYKAGLTSGSGGITALYIESMDGKELLNARELAEALEPKVPGDVVSLSVSGMPYLVTLEAPPGPDTDVDFRFIESQEETSVLVQLTETVAEVPIDIIEKTAAGAVDVLSGAADVVEEQTGLLGAATGTVLALGLLGAGVYFAYDRERRR